MKSDKNLLLDVEAKINECIEVLKKISGSCCMPERSANMDDAFSILDNIITTLKLAHNDEDSVHKAIHQIGEAGKSTGFLFATCCTATRESLYLKMYQLKSEVHGKLYSYLGYSH